jgi:hypothetical protein
MSQTTDTFNPFDPTGMFKSIRDSNMDAWSRMMIEFVNTDAYAQATGTMLDAWLSNSTPFRKALEATLVQVLANLHLPTRDEVAGLAERLTNIEMRLDDMEAKLDESLRASRESVGSKARSGGKPRSSHGEGQP